MSQPLPLVERTFTYSSQTLDGRPFTGTINAADNAEATRQLQSLQLRIIQIEPVPEAPRGKPLRGDDFIAFNQQLAQLTAAGMPVEQGLRPIAQDMRRRHSKSRFPARAGCPWPILEPVFLQKCQLGSTFVFH